MYFYTKPVVMKGISIFSLIFCFCLSVNAQRDTSAFNFISKTETNEYIISVPEKWTRYVPLDQSTKEYKFEFTGVAIPAQINNAPLVATCTTRRFVTDSINRAIDFVLGEFTGLPDRITQAGYNYDTEDLTIASGQKATLISTRFYRRSKVSNYSRYDMIVYSAKFKTAYIVTITYQYKDPSYMCETDHKFREYAFRIFKRFQVRQ
jgi:hypothetical protein